MLSRAPKLFKKKAINCLFVILVMLFASCAKQVHRDKMTFDELSTNAKTALEKKNREKAIAYLEEILARFADHTQISKYKILLAEMYFKDGKYAASQQLYEHFNQFYPADKRAEYSKYKSILAMFYQTLGADCDQTETQETIKLCQEYLKNTNFKQYSKDIKDILISCENRLIDKEIYVFNFYLKQEQCDAAQKRLKYLKDKYLAQNAGLDARLLYLECKLAQRQKNKTLVQENIKKLRQLHPNSQFTRMAQNLTITNTFDF